MKEKFIHILKEFQQHLPYTIFSAIVGMVTLGIFTVLLEPEVFPQASQKLFHIFHPVHMLLSATVTTAMFWRHDKKILKAITIGFIGSVGICGISDIIIPFISGLLLGTKMEFHICIIMHPGLIAPFVLFGIFIGFIIPPIVASTVFSHATHVFISSMASILYLVSFGLVNWIPIVGMVFIYTVLAVIIPCCTSDIVFPLLFTKKTT